MIEWFEGPRSELADLFALADDSAVQVERYRDLGRVLVARDGSTLIGHLQLIPCEHTNEAEIKSLAVREDRQGSGIGRSLMTRAIAACREQDRAALVVATAAADTGVLRFYQRLGFRFLRVERDVFTPEAGYPPTEVGGVAAFLVIGVDASVAISAMLLMRMLSIGTALVIALATIVVVRDEFRALLRERARAA